MEIANIYRELEQEAQGSVEKLAEPGTGAVFTRTAEMRYAGQFHEVEVGLRPGPITSDFITEAIQAFHKRHEALYTFAMPWRETEFLTFRLRATVPRANFRIRKIAAGGADASGAIKRERRCMWSGQMIDTPIYPGEILQAGNHLPGPAVIEEQTTTVLIPHNFVGEVDANRNFIFDARQRTLFDDAGTSPRQHCDHLALDADDSREMRHIIDRTAQNYLILSSRRVRRHMDCSG